jgi:hypothetical protein
MPDVYYDRMRAIVDIIPAHQTIEIDDLIAYIKTHMYSPFIVSPPGTMPVKFLSDRDIRRIINQMKEVKIVVITEQNYINFNPEEKYPENDAEFNILLAKLVRDYFKEHGAKPEDL